MNGGEGAPTTQPNEDDLRDRLRRALPVAMKAQDRPAVAALRSTLAAIDNAEAVDPDEAWPDDMDEDFHPASTPLAGRLRTPAPLLWTLRAGGSLERSRVLVRRR